MDTTVVIIGAGISGLTAARVLQRAGIPSLVLDKGRAVGGRLATRTIGEARFDHGAQHFAIRSVEAAEMVREWQRAGVVRSWYRAGNNTERLVGVGGMRRIPEFLASSLQVRTGTTVERLAVDGTSVGAIVSDGQPIIARAAIVTPPIPQTLALLQAGGSDPAAAIGRELHGIRYNACLTAMMTLSGRGGLPGGHLSPDAGPVAWLADNAHKGTSPVPSVTVHSTPDFAARYLEDDPEVWTDLLVSAARPSIQGSITSVQAHRWRYAEPTRTLQSRFALLDTTSPVVLAGEVFAGARVEGALLSGIAAGRAMAERLA